MKIIKHLDRLRYTSFGTAPLRILAVILVCAVTLSFSGGYAGVAAEAPQDDRGYSDGVDVLGVSSQYEQETLSSVSVQELWEILHTSAYYDEELFEWVVTNGTTYGERFGYAVNLLKQYPTETEANAFLQLMAQLRNDSPQHNNEIAISIPGLDRAAQDLAQRVGIRGSLTSQSGEQTTTFEKIWSKDDAFRHYNVEVSFKPSEIIKANSEPCDVVLLIDASESMAGQRIESAKSIASSLVWEAFRRNEQNRVGLVVYRESGVVESALSTQLSKGSVLSAIASIQAMGDSNRQSGILFAGELLGTASDDASRRKVVVDLTDGGANVSATDSWAYSVQDAGLAVPNQKRWAYAASGDYLAPAVSTTYWGETRENQARCARLAALEAQYLVASGVDLFVVDYSAGQESDLTLSTYPMTSAPTGFAYGFSAPEAVRRYNPVASVGYQTEGYTGRVLRAENGLELVDGLELIFGEQSVEKSMPSFTITDTIDTERFELVGEPEITGGGMQESTTVYNPDTGKLEWFSNGEESDQSRMVTYTVRVVDEKVFPDGAGELSVVEGETITVSTDSTISWVAEDGVVEETVPSVFAISMESLLTASAQVRNIDGSEIDRWVDGRNVLLTGIAQNGGGNYTAQWYQGDKTVGDVFALDEKTSVEDAAVTDRGFSVTDLPNGVTNFSLRVTDVQAHKAGYTTEGVAWVEVPVTATVAYGVVHVQVEGPVGYYETRIAVASKQGDKSWNLLGTGTNSYEFVAGTTIYAETYAPPGYAVKGGGSVEIIPRADGSVAEQTIVIRVTAIERQYIFNWVQEAGSAEE